MLEAVCWDRDRFGKDYLGEFDVAVEEIFANSQTAQEVSELQAVADVSADFSKPRWYTLESRRKGEQKRGAKISGEVQLQFSLVDTQDSSARPPEILQKLAALLALSAEDESDGDEDLTRLDSLDLEDDDEDEDELDEKNPDTSDETDDPTKPAKAEKEKRKRRLRLKRMKTRAKARAYEFTGGTDVVGIVFLEICKITDLPPERNSKRAATICSHNFC